MDIVVDRNSGSVKKPSYFKCSVTGKSSYPSKVIADEQINKFKTAKRKVTMDGKRVNHRQGKPDQKRSYYCIHCNGYHMTSWDKDNNYKFRKDFREKMTREGLIRDNNDTSWKSDSLPFPLDKINKNE